MDTTVVAGWLLPGVCAMWVVIPGWAMGGEAVARSCSCSQYMSDFTRDWSFESFRTRSADIENRARDVI